jgi:DNA repair protein RadC
MPFLDNLNLDRALHLLDQVHGLGYLLQLGEAELEGLGLSESERMRLCALTPMASRLLCAKAKMSDPATRRELADEITFRSIGWEQVTAGVMVWNTQGQRVADRILAVGTSESVEFNLLQALRIALCTPRAASFVLWIFQPTTRILVNEQDRATANEMRIMAAAVRLRVEDILLVAPGDAVSLAVLDQWVD